MAQFFFVVFWHQVSSLHSIVSFRQRHNDLIIGCGARDESLYRTILCLIITSIGLCADVTLLERPIVPSLFSPILHQIGCHFSSGSREPRITQTIAIPHRWVTGTFLANKELNFFSKIKAQTMGRRRRLKSIKAFQIGIVERFWSQVSFFSTRRPHSGGLRNAALSCLR